ncbi:MAG: hypothetical protein WC755_03030 [Candidatus Woesearchaeota archaeon]|jgi:hypothetical protein
MKNQSATGNKIELESVCRDLFESFNKSLIPDKKWHIDEYFAEKMKSDEMEGQFVKPAHYDSLKDIVTEEVIPIYEEYEKKKKEIAIKQEKQSLLKYVAGTVIIAELLEAIASRGRTLRPLVILSTVPFEAVLGVGIYKVVQWNQKRKLNGAKKEFFNSIKELDKKLKTDKKYEMFSEIMDGDLLKTEVYQLLTKYDDKKPNDFWQDYRKIRIADPKNNVAFEEMLKLKSSDAWQGFLDLHLKGAYNEEKRNSRFDKLFIMAHEYYMQKNRNYVINQI